MYILLVFLLIIIALLVAVNIYMIKFQAKQRHLLLYYNTSKLKIIDIRNILFGPIMSYKVLYTYNDNK